MDALHFRRPLNVYSIRDSYGDILRLRAVRCVFAGGMDGAGVCRGPRSRQLRAAAAQRGRRQECAHKCAYMYRLIMPPVHTAFFDVVEFTALMFVLLS